ncbi:hypothetical protein [Enterobacter cloacae]|uniref:hypothetical protein n=1 Tax=Enterobacter cloacae TaxID=550 RepID=UPI0009B525D9|nr:hypothetical protein [Enterobacter cloacae]
MTQHFKIKGNYAVERRLNLYNISVNAEICRQEETAKPTNSYLFKFQQVACRWIATMKKDAVGE